MGSFRKQIRIFLHFLALSFIQLLELQEVTVLRLVWMVELLFLSYKPFGQRYVINILPRTGLGIWGIQVVDHYQEQYWAEFCSLGNAGSYWEPVRDRAIQLNALSAVS